MKPRSAGLRLFVWDQRKAALSSCGSKQSHSGLLSDTGGVYRRSNPLGSSLRPKLILSNRSPIFLWTMRCSSCGAMLFLTTLDLYCRGFLCLPVSNSTFPYESGVSTFVGSYLSMGERCVPHSTRECSFTNMNQRFLSPISAIQSAACWVYSVHNFLRSAFLAVW